VLVLCHVHHRFECSTHTPPQVKHPAAKSMIELARAQDEEVGDGTTAVIILAGEMMTVAEPLLEKKLHPTVITGSYYQALQNLLKHLDDGACACSRTCMCSCVDCHSPSPPHPPVVPY